MKSATIERIDQAPASWRRTAIAAAIAAAFVAGQVQANGTSPTVVAGKAGFSTQGGSLSITNSPGTIINWQGFSIGAGESTRFIQQSAASSVLNRVIGPDPSVILGTLSSNGRVFLINPSGILVGQGARIDVAGLVASTLNLSNQDFLAGRLNFTANPLAGKVENQGSITTPSGGSVYLVGSSVANSGIINSPQGDVILAAGQSVKIFDTSTPGVRVELTASDNAAVNLGDILAQSGQVGIYGAVLRNAGVINADQVVRSASGKIVLRAKQDVTLDAGSQLSANGEQGGEITVQSESGTTLASGIIEARGTGEAAGTGGTIKVLGNMQTGLVNLGGTLDASAANGGDGGFIETSAARVRIADSAFVTTRSAQGKSGTWLIDPYDFTVGATATGIISSGNPSGDVSGSTLTTALGNGSVTILSSQGSTAAGNGDINVNDAVSWSANTFTLTAARDININAVMTASGNSSLVMNTATENLPDAAVAGGAVKVGMNAGGFTGRVDFPGRSGASILTINGLGYTIIDALGAPTSTTVTDLQGMNSGLALNYALGTNIDATDTSTWNSGAGFAPIGTYTGKFDGLGHTITGLTINRPVTANVGLFGTVGASASYTIRNVGLVGGSVTGAAGTGGLIGVNGAGTVSNSYNTGSVSGAAGTGGLIGTNGAGNAVTNSFATGTVTGSAGAVGVGGLVGSNGAGSPVSNSYATGAVTTSAGAASVGGLVGSNGALSAISESYAAGAVTNTGAGAAGVGGLVGSNTTGTVTDSYATGNVSNSGAGAAGTGGLIGSNTSGAVNDSYAAGSVTAIGASIGGLVGSSNAGTVVHSFWDTTTSGQAASAGGGVGMTTAQMKTQLNFTSSTLANAPDSPNWNFPATWVMYEGETYPLLWSFMTPLTVTANDANKTYGQSNPAFSVSYSSAPNGNLLGAVSYGGNSQTAINAGSYVITPSGLYSNQQGYIISYANGTLSVAKAALTATADNQSKTYGGADPALTYTVGGTLFYTDTASVVSGVSLSTATDALATAGTHTILASGGTASNYDITTANGTLSVAKAALTATADNQSKTYGGADPALTYTVGGTLFYTDTTASVLSGALTRVSGETVVGGPYAITQGTLTSNSNYALNSFTGGSFSITPASLNVVANAQNKLFGTSDPLFTYTVAGLVNNPGLGVVDTTGSVLSGALTRVPGETVLGGPYTITQGSLLANGNYLLDFTPSSLTIIGGAALPPLVFNMNQIVYVGVTNSEYYYRPGNFWHIALNANHADPGFDVMRGAEDLATDTAGEGARQLSGFIGGPKRRKFSCDSVLGGGFCETWSFPQQSEKIHRK